MLVIEKLSFSFPGRTLLDSVSVQLRTHAVTCLLGGNGSGKTTLFNLITGFLRPDAGSIRLGETEITNRAPFRISRAGVARTFQDLRLIGKLSVRENILLALTRPPDERLGRALLPMGARAFFLSSSTDEKPEAGNQNEPPTSNADTLLAEYFLAEVADQPASEISYGQQKLLTLACCAALDASLLLLDEPVAGISPEYRERIAERLASLKAAGKTILLIEHQPDFLERTGDAFLYLQAGRLHRFDTLTALRIAHDALS